MKNSFWFLIVILLIGCEEICFSQTTNISGTINTYSAVSAIDYGSNQVTVSSTTGFTINGKVMIIQMKGVDINTSNSGSFGSITNYNDAGKYEFLTVCGITGNDIQFTYTIQNTYAISAAVQLITVPQYTNADITATLTAMDWDGSIGGVLAFEVDNQLTFSADIDVTGSGFRGGAFSNSSFSCAWYSLQTNYFYNLTTGKGAKKGEGITSYVTASNSGKGPLANGGGGANDHNGGGAGGSNYSAGGDGGDRVPQTMFYCKCYDPGLGGKNLTYSNAQNRVFLGGGGGAGHGNNSAGSDGADGGGVVIIKAAILEGNNYNIIAKGDNSALSTYDGSGGGGGAGSILLDVASFSSSTLNIQLQGGNGGNTNNGGASQCNGPGGGGGGGILWLSASSLPANVSPSYSGGSAGITTASSQSGCTVGGSNNATSGFTGGLLTSLSIPESSTASGSCTPLPVQLISFSGRAEEKKVLLTWVTVMEIENDHFSIERSSDGIRFNRIGVKLGRGTTSETSIYNFEDIDPQSEVHYYRLKQVDKNGEFHYSPVIAVELSSYGFEVVKVFPNPTYGQLELTLQLPSKEKVIICLINMIGERILLKEVHLDKGLNNVTLKLSDLVSGIYFVRIQERENIIVKRIIKN